MDYNPIYTLSSFRGCDDMERFSLAMQALRSHPGSALFVEPGIYHITDQLSRETQEHVMAGVYGPNPQHTMFNPKFPYTRGLDFQGQKNTALLGYGVTLEIDGFMEPISLRDCENVTLKGITIRHKRKPYSAGTIHKVGNCENEGKVGCIVNLDEDCPVKKDSPLSLRVLLYSVVNDRMVKGKFHLEEFIDAYHLRGYIENPDEDIEGIRYYTAHTYHSRPAILVERAKDILIEDVTINNQPGMGIVGNRSENVILRRLAILPVSGDHYSTNTDGTHFTSMKGLLRYENCFFDGIGDDFANVHAYYQKIVKKENARIVYLQEKTPDGTHAQSLDYPDIGDSLEMNIYQSLKPIDTFKVISCTPMPEEWMCRVELDHDVPDQTDDLIFADITRLPRLEVIGCVAQNHFARGVLCKCRDCLIEGNTFRNIHGPGVVLAAECYWYEGVCPAHVIIRNNYFDHTAYFWGDAGGIVVKADAPKSDEPNIFDITIENNLIYTPNKEHGIFIRNTKNAKIHNNKIVSSDDPIVIDHSEIVEVINNHPRMTL